MRHLNIQRTLLNRPLWQRLFMLAFLLYVLWFCTRFLPKIEARIYIGKYVVSSSMGKDPDARWDRVSPGILRFEGAWNVDHKDSAKQLKELLEKYPEPVTLIRITDSPGGETTEAIRNAELLLPFHPRIVVEGSCMSSCANYLLPIASEIDVRANAVIGYHGHVCGLDPASESCGIEKEFWAKLENGNKISQLPVGRMVGERPSESIAWMPMPEDFVKAGYPKMVFDWLPQPDTMVRLKTYVAPLPEGKNP